MNRDRSRRRGFTLIEILIVVIIAGLMAAIAMPGFTRAMKGAQLRSAARTLSMAHKFARNTAVLRQTPMALLVDTEARAIEVLSLHSRNSKFARGGFLDDRAERAATPVDEEGQPAPEAPAEKPQIESEFQRTYGAEVSLDAFETADGREAEELKGVYWVNYQPNGMCDGFRIRLVDANGQKVTITAEGISGAAEVMWER
jgi:type II secretion system protein H